MKSFKTLIIILVGLTSITTLFAAETEPSRELDEITPAELQQKQELEKHSPRFSQFSNEGEPLLEEGTLTESDRELTKAYEEALKKRGPFGGMLSICNRIQRHNSLR